VNVIYYNLAKMFDKIKHQKLLAALDAHGINKDGRVYAWIKVWLIGKLQQVLVLGKKSLAKEVLASVVQGSSLGPRLAKIFGNTTNTDTKMKDIDHATEHKFADDEKRLRLAKEEEQRVRMKENIDKMQLWCVDSDMSLNRDKVHTIHFGDTNMEQEYYLDEGRTEVIT
jgi:hypothetical protein